ncbi:MAG TPA: toll/interleukin-1 receptor domain-containing protein, partial [Thermoanaerobaculia bacterium]
VPTEDIPETGALHEVASRFLAQGGELEDIYPALKSLLPAAEKMAVPEPLLQLARIRPFKLFVSATFDPLLEMALNQVRFGGQPRTRVFAYSPNAVQDLDQPIEEMDRPVVFHLFGRLSAVPDYAVTDEDTLEFVHSLQSESHRPNLLLDEVSRGQILLIGGNFPDWLARFFLRIARRERLWMARGKTDIVADAHMRDDPSLVAFLQRFSSRTKIFQSGGAVEFVAELSRRWSERHPEAEAAVAALPAEPARVIGDPLEMLAGSIFLSYASEDRPAVDALRQQLEAAGVDVWFDRQALQAGDDYEAKIKRNIENASLFIPILSRNTLTERRRFFRIEWDHAEKIAVQVPANQRYIIPVVIDDVAPNDPMIPERFRKINWVRIEPGAPSPDLVAILRQLFRDYQRQLAATS